MAKRAELRRMRQNWKDRVTNVLRELGAVPTEHTSQGSWHSMYPFVIEDTQAGPLLFSVSPSLDWEKKIGAGGSVFCRFTDVEKAKQFFKVDRLGNHAGLNVYSGKWNHHYFDWSTVCSCRDIRSEVERVLP
jgi:hypothetical protein